MKVDFGISNIPSCGLRSRHFDRHYIYFQWWINEQRKKFIRNLGLSSDEAGLLDELVEPDYIIMEVNVCEKD